MIITQISKFTLTQLDELNDLLFDSVVNGASVGFVHPITEKSVMDYWKSVVLKLGNFHFIWFAFENETIIGSVQLSRCSTLNGLHRAEVQKLLVHSEYRGSGIASKLMDSLEEYAKSIQITLLTLDTQTGSIAEKFYIKQGWLKVGEIPDYAKSPDGKLSATIFFYKSI